jgi:hypothetical protein
MTKKNLKPQQAAPVQREINNTTGTGLTPRSTGLVVAYFGDTPQGFPFAGDDAE